MPAGLRCPGCGSSNVIEDNLYCQAQSVCADCGFVVSEGLLANEPGGGSNVSYIRTTAEVRKPCPNLKLGLERVRAICRTLRLHSDIEVLSESHFNRAYLHESFLHVSLQRKEVLGGCSVLVSCRLLNWPITVGTISYLLDADPAMVGTVYHEMVKILNIEAPIVNITDLMEAHSQEYKISSVYLPEEFSANPKDLTKRAVALVELAADSWIVTGRRPVPIMMATIYLAWQSLKPSRHRLKMSLEKFCNMAKVSKHRPALKRVTEIKEVLCKLGQEIPWITDAVTPDNVLWQVDDILKYRPALLRRALRTQVNLLERQAGAVDSLAEDKTPSYITEVVDKTPNASTVETCEVIAKQQPEDGVDNTLTGRQLPSDAGTTKNQDPAADWGKRLLFAPPCVIHAKKRRVEQQELRDVTGDEEISDSEIESYIRSPEEARDFALTQKML